MSPRFTTKASGWALMSSITRSKRASSPSPYGASPKIANENVSGCGGAVAHAGTSSTSSRPASLVTREVLEAVEGLERFLGRELVGLDGVQRVQRRRSRGLGGRGRPREQVR